SLEPQDVAMAADEYVWRILFQLGRHLAIPSAGPSADVGHPKLKALDLGAKVLGGSCANGRAVHVSKTASTGASFPRRSRMSGVPTSPAWRMRSMPARYSSSAGW